MKNWLRTISCLLVLMPSKIVRFDSGHVTVPVMHPSGEVHHIAVPENTPLADFHSALSDYYHETKPTKEGAVEFSPEFRAAAKKAVTMATLEASRRKHGENAGGEAGFSVHGSGETSPVKFSQDQEPSGGSMHQSVSGDDLGALHTHDSFHKADPSGGDEAAAKQAHTTVWVASRDGLYGVDPSGEPTKVFSNPNWYNAPK